MKNIGNQESIRAVTLLGHLLVQQQEDPDIPEWKTLATIPLEALKEAWEEWEEISRQLDRR